MDTCHELFSTAAEGKGRIFYSIYADIQDDVWIKFWGHFVEDPERRNHPWRIQEYFGAEYRLEDYLCIPEDILREDLSEIKQTIGNMTEAEALYDMNHFFVRYCFPPQEGPVRFLPVSEVTMETPCGLYIS